MEICITSWLTKAHNISKDHVPPSLINGLLSLLVSEKRNQSIQNRTAIDSATAFPLWLLGCCVTSSQANTVKICTIKFSMCLIIDATSRPQKLGVTNNWLLNILSKRDEKILSIGMFFVVYLYQFPVLVSVSVSCNVITFSSLVVAAMRLQAAVAILNQCACSSLSRVLIQVSDIQ